MADEEGHELFRSQVDESENLREDARNLLLFEQAREWLWRIILTIQGAPVNVTMTRAAARAWRGSGMAGFVVGLVFLILFLVKQLGGTTGGWRRLAEVYGCDKPSRGQIVTGRPSRSVP